MKLLLIVGSDKTFNLVASYVRPLGFELIRYRHALKSMDNIDEVDPDAVIISAEDFPRHWKPLVQFIRSERPKDKTAIVILKGPNFAFEEAAKASFIGVSGIVSENLSDPEELDRLQSILGRYIPIDEGRAAKRIRPAEWDRFNFMFSRPQDQAVVMGRIETISTVGLSFLPDHPNQMNEVYLDTELSDCSLRAGNHILSPVCKLVRTGRIVSFSFISFPGDERKILEDYLLERPFRERRELEQAHSSIHEPQSL